MTVGIFILTLASLFISGSSAGSRDCDCGLKMNEGRIVGGHEAAPFSNPWVVAVVSSTSTFWPFCGATLLNSRWVLTAGHCVKGRKPADIRLALGGHNSANFTDIIAVDKIVLRPNFKDHRMEDVALIRFKAIRFRNTITPACLPSEAMAFDKLIAVGWGRTSYEGVKPHYLQETTLKFISHDKCLGYEAHIDLKQHICAGNPSTNLCYGDSGGPLLHKLQGRVYVVGVASFTQARCEPGRPGVFARVSYFLDWINENIADGDFCRNPMRPGSELMGRLLGLI